MEKPVKTIQIQLPAPPLHMGREDHGSPSLLWGRGQGDGVFESEEAGWMRSLKVKRPSGWGPKTGRGPLDRTLAREVAIRLVPSVL